MSPGPARFLCTRRPIAVAGMHGHGEQASEVCPLQHRQDRLLHAHLPAAGAPGEERGGQRCLGWEGVCVSLLPGARLPPSGQVTEEAWVLIEELSPKMTLEVASGLFELYLTLADIQRLWSSTPGWWVPCPPVPSLPVSRPIAPVCLLPPTCSAPCLCCPTCTPASSRRALGQKPQCSLTPGP